MARLPGPSELVDVNVRHVLKHRGDKPAVERDSHGDVYLRCAGGVSEALCGETGCLGKTKRQPGQPARLLVVGDAGCVSRQGRVHERVLGQGHADRLTKQSSRTRRVGTCPIGANCAVYARR